MATDCLFKITLQLKEVIEREGRIITYINIPCGRCARCIERRKMEWAFRMEKEMEISKTAYFVTLTYAPETVPYNKWGKKTLVKKDLTKFFKRLRRNQERSKPTIEFITNNLVNTDKIKYYAAGEYGEEKGRPHYHAIIFNTSERNIIKSWDLGGVHVVKANEATIAYVMKYLDKRYDKKQNWGIQAEFNTMSEGIGKHYIDKNITWHKRNIDVLFVTNQNGVKIPMPKYYREKIFTNEEREQQVIIVTDILKDIREESIEELGRELYNHKQIKLKDESERRFKKKIKKRIVD